VKQQTYWEQPDVLFRNALLLQVLDDDGVSSQYSTVSSIHEQSMNPLSLPTIKMTKSEGADNKVDNLRLQISFKGDPSKVR
jgi:hypothetical protein